MNRRVSTAFAVILIPATLFVIAAGCGKSEKKVVKPPMMELAIVKADTVSLFDGSNLDAWTMENPGGWAIADSAMTIAKGGSIWTRERFGDFDLSLEFKVSREGNSGVFIRIGDLKDPVQTGIEMQILDSAGKAKPDKHDSGALYDLLEPSSNAMKPAGEWNRAVITCHMNHITIEMNGTQIIAADLDRWTTPHKNPDGSENKFNLALKDFPREGHIGFQDHGFPVWFRNVMVKKMKMR